MILPTNQPRERKSHLWERDPHDWYVEPRWCSDALFGQVKFDGLIVDPCCGIGRILDAARYAGYDTFGIDICDRGAGLRHPFEQRDFFTVTDTLPNIVCNPPYRYAERFVAHCNERVARKAAVLLRAQWANAFARSCWLESLPLRYVLALSPRPSMPPGAVVVSGGRVGGGTTDYSWFVFDRDYQGRPEFGWARRGERHACAAALERDRAAGTLFAQEEAP